MIKGVLFDLDGTLLDRDRSLIAFLEHQYHRIHACIMLIKIFSFKDLLNWIRRDMYGKTRSIKASLKK